MLLLHCAFSNDDAELIKSITMAIEKYLTDLIAVDFRCWKKDFREKLEINFFLRGRDHFEKANKRIKDCWVRIKYVRMSFKVIPDFQNIQIKIKSYLHESRCNVIIVLRQIVKRPIPT